MLSIRRHFDMCSIVIIQKLLENKREFLNQPNQRENYENYENSISKFILLEF